MMYRTWLKSMGNHAEGHVYSVEKLVLCCKKHGTLTLACFPIRSECVAFPAFTHTGIFCIHKLLFTPMGVISTVIDLCRKQSVYQESQTLGVSIYYTTLVKVFTSAKPQRKIV